MTKKKASKAKKKAATAPAAAPAEAAASAPADAPAPAPRAARLPTPKSNLPRGSKVPPRDPKAAAAKAAAAKAAKAAKDPSSPGTVTVVCTMTHMRGKTVKVDQTTYKVGPDMWIRDVEPEHARELFSMAGFRPLGPLKGTRAATATEPPLPPPTGAIKLLNADGRTVDKVLEEREAQEAENRELSKAAAKPEDTSGDPPIPTEGEEWVDPDPKTQSMTYLRSMADAHGVDHVPQDTKENLAERIKSVLYG